MEYERTAVRINCSWCPDMSRNLTPLGLEPCPPSSWTKKPWVCPMSQGRHSPWCCIYPCFCPGIFGPGDRASCCVLLVCCHCHGRTLTLVSAPTLPC